MCKNPLSASYLNVGISYYHLGNYDNASQYIKKSKEIFPVAAENDKDMANILNSMGALFSEFAKREKDTIKKRIYSNDALDSCLQALIIRQRVLLPDDQAITVSMNNVGKCYSNLEDYENAVKCHEDALKLKRKKLLPNDISIATTLGNLGVCYSKLGKQKDALDSQLEALDIRKINLPSDHPYIAESFYHVGCVYINLYNTIKAKEYLTDSLNINKKLRNIKACEECQKKLNEMDSYIYWIKKKAREIEDFGYLYKKTKVEYKTNSDSLPYRDKHLTHYEKALIYKRSSTFGLPLDQVSIDLDIQHEGVIQFYGSVALFLENSHSLHLFNVLSLITMIENNQITPDTVICIERKQYGNNLGMQDVIILADILKYNESPLEGNKMLLPEYIQELPIYSDALLYNAARDKDIKVIGIEGKSLACSKESPYYHHVREEYMVNQLIDISQLGKKSIFLVGSAHIEALKSLFDGYRAEAKYFYELNVLHLPYWMYSMNQLPIVDSYNSLVICAHPEQNNIPYRSMDIFKNFVGNYIGILKEADNIFESFSAQVLDNPSIRSYLLNYVYGEKLVDIQALLSQEYIKSSNINGMKKILQKSPFEWSKQDFRKIYLTTHPDKGGKSNDFRVVQEFEQQTRFQGNSDNNLLMKAFEKLFHSIQEFISITSISFKLLDTATDGARFVCEPTIVHVKSVIIDSTYLFAMYTGVNGYSSIINAGDISYKLHQGEYIQALKQAATIATYMLLPSMLNYMEAPYIGLLYTTIAGYNGYSAIFNAYSFYIEYGSDNFNMKSYTAYKDASEILSNSPLQYIYDFKVLAKGYEANLHEIKFSLEKFAVEKQLLVDKGEFGQKLYDYIYAPLLEEKYVLLNKVVQGVLTEDQAEGLRSKHISIIIAEQIYDHCMEVKALTA